MSEMQIQLPQEEKRTEWQTLCLTVYFGFLIKMNCLHIKAASALQQLHFIMFYAEKQTVEHHAESISSYFELSG